MLLIMANISPSLKSSAQFLASLIKFSFSIILAPLIWLFIALPSLRQNRSNQCSRMCNSCHFLNLPKEVRQKSGALFLEKHFTTEYLLPLAHSSIFFLLRRFIIYSFQLILNQFF